MIDTHCHIDQYDDPAAVADAVEQQSILTVVVTNLPSHFRLAAEHLAGYKFVQPALGLHPLAVRDHSRELPVFLEMVENAKYIGEIGLDFSKADIQTRAIQIKSFRTVLSAMKTARRFVTVHSRGAEETILDCLAETPVGPVCFHWYSGNASILRRVLEAGHFLALNPAMLRVKKWSELFKAIPHNRVLTETDGPFSRCNGEPSRPEDIRNVLEWISIQWGCSWQDAQSAVAENFEYITGNK